MRPLLAITAVLFSVGVALAVEVEPSRLELKIPANQPTRGELLISNPGRQPVEVRLSTGPYRFLDPAIKLSSCQDWFRFEPNRLTLAAGATTAVAYTVTPPSNLDVDTAGEYLGAILVDQYPAEQPVRPEQAVHPSTNAQGERRVEGPVAQEAHLTVVPRLALAVYLTIQGRERVEVNLTDVKVGRFEGQTPHQGMREPPPDLLRINVTLKNKGTVHVRPSGTYALFDSENHLVRASPLGKAMPLLPTADMTIPVLLPLPPAGRYRLVTTIEVIEGVVLQKELSFEVTPEKNVVQGKTG